MDEIVGENVDRTITIEMRPRGMPRGTIHRLYEVARRKQGQPLAMLAATKLANLVEPGDYVVIGTGAFFPPWLVHGETDGPPGAVALAKVLIDVLQAKPLLICEKECLGVVRSNCQSIGLKPTDFDSERTGGANTVMVGEFTKDSELAQVQSAKIIFETAPKAVVMTEKLGKNAKGQYHSAMGSNGTEYHAKMDHLVELARKRGILTIGIGDVGNEIGFGLVHDEVRNLVPNGIRCQCGCGDGIVTVTKTDVLVVAAISNWGAYGISDCLCFLRNMPDACLTPAMLVNMLEACVMEKVPDGLKLKLTPTEDGATQESSIGMINILSGIVHAGLWDYQREF